MSTLNIAIAQDIESSKDSEVFISDSSFDSSSPSTFKYREESKQIADILTKFSNSIPKEDFKADILLTKYQSNLDSLKDELSVVLSHVSESVYDSLTKEFKVNLSQVDKEELTQIVLSDYKRILDESEQKRTSESKELKSDESDEGFRVVEVEADLGSRGFRTIGTKVDSNQRNFRTSKTKTDFNSKGFKAVRTKTDFNSRGFKTSESETDSDFRNFKAIESETDSELHEFKTVETGTDLDFRNNEDFSSSPSDELNEEFRVSEVKTDSNFRIDNKSENSSLSDNSDKTFKAVESEKDSESQGFKHNHRTLDSSSNSFNTVDSVDDETSSLKFTTAKEVLDSRNLEFELKESDYDYSEIEANIKNPTFEEDIKTDWKNIVDETKSELFINSVGERVNKGTASSEAWVTMANDIAMSTTSSVFNAGVKLANSVDGKSLQVITDLPGYLSSVINKSLINPTKSFVHDISSSVADMVRDVVNAPVEILNSVVGKFTDIYSSFLGGISSKVSNFTDNVSSKINNLVTGLFDKSEITMRTRNYVYRDNRAPEVFKSREFNSEYGSAVGFSTKDKNLEYGSLVGFSAEDKSLEYGSATGFSPRNTNLEYDSLTEFSDKNIKPNYSSIVGFSPKNIESNYESNITVSLGKLNSSSPKRSDFKDSSLEFLSDAFWDIQITPHKFNENSVSPPNLLGYYGLERLPIISFDLSGEMIDNSDFELYNSFMTSYPSMYSRMNRLTISLPEMIRKYNGESVSSLRNFKEDYISYVTNDKLSPSFRDFRYCAYEIEVTKFTQSWSLVKTWKLLGIPEFNNATRGGSDSNIEIGEISFNIVGEDLTTTDALIAQNNESTMNDLLAEKEYNRKRGL